MWLMIWIAPSPDEEIDTRITMWVAPESKISRLYDSTAWYWDSWIHRAIYEEAYRRLFEALQAEWRIEASARPFHVLDCGTGTGLLIQALTRTTQAIPDVHGIDASPGMLNRSRRNLEERGIRADLRQADICALPFADGGMDLVMEALVLEHIAEPGIALREMARVARPGATVLLVATRPHAPDLPFRVAFHYKPFSENRVFEWMADSGIEAVCVRPLSGFARLLAQAYVGRRAKTH